MSTLRTDGFAALVTTAANEMTNCPTLAAAIRHAASLGGRAPTSIGLAALTTAEQHHLAEAERAAATLRPQPPAQSAGPSDTDHDRIALTGAGRLRLLRRREPCPPGIHLVGAVHWPAGRPAELDVELDRLDACDAAERSAIRAWLAMLEPTRVNAMIDRIRHALQHMAPVLLHVGQACYTNLGRHSNLVGKSVRADSPRCVLNALTTTPVTNWSDLDATFLTCVHALISSGPPVRAEEFSGTQLSPGRVEAFLYDRLRAYGAEPPPATEPSTDRSAPTGERLGRLATACARARARALARGARPYRVIHALSLNKREIITDRPVTIADVPRPVLEAFASELSAPVPNTLDAVRELCQRTMPALLEPGGPGFSSRFEEVLNELLRAATEATGSDAGMSRGPRRPGHLADLIARGDSEPVSWPLDEYACCVTPSTGFVKRFAEQPQELSRVLRAISTRMRFNCWHYAPDTFGMTHAAEGRDWFFTPGMADVTAWSDQHHTGHVAHGVRYAIRVPFGVVLAGAERSGSHDFRLMRVDGDPYTEEDLHQAMAIAEVLRRYHQAGADHGEPGNELVIRDFSNTWYSTTYDTVIER